MQEKAFFKMKTLQKNDVLASTQSHDGSKRRYGLAEVSLFP